MRPTRSTSVSTIASSQIGDAAFARISAARFGLHESAAAGGDHAAGRFPPAAARSPAARHRGKWSSPNLSNISAIGHLGGFDDRVVGIGEVHASVFASLRPMVDLPTPIIPTSTNGPRYPGARARAIVPRHREERAIVIAARPIDSANRAGKTVPGLSGTGTRNGEAARHVPMPDIVLALAGLALLVLLSGMAGWRARGKAPDRRAAGLAGERFMRRKPCCWAERRWRFLPRWRWRRAGRPAAARLQRSAAALDARAHAGTNARAASPAGHAFGASAGFGFRASGAGLSLRRDPRLPLALPPPVRPLPADFPTLAELEAMEEDEINEAARPAPEVSISPQPPAVRWHGVGRAGQRRGRFSSAFASPPARCTGARRAGRQRGPLVSRWGHILLRRALASRLDAPAGMDPAEFAALRARALDANG